MTIKELETKLNRPVTQRMLDIWNGKRVNPMIAEKYKDVWLQNAPPDPNTTDPVHVRISAGGLGDALQGLIAVCSLARQRRVYYHVDFHNWLSLFYHELAPIKLPGVPIQGIDLNTHYDRECRHRCEKPRHVRYCEALGVEPVMPELKDRERLTEKGKQYKDTIVFIPFSNSPTRNWSINHWLTLESMITNPVVVLDNRTVRVHRFKSKKMLSANAEDVASLLLNCKCAVAVDTGVTHFAGLLGTKTICLTGPTTVEGVFSYYPNVQGITGSLNCAGCYWQPPHYDPVCANACACLFSIDPKKVVKKISSIR